MISVGVTGGIGSGKSIVCKVFEAMDFPVFYADSEAKKCMNHDPQLIEGIQSVLGFEAYKNGEIDKVFIANKIFSNEDLKLKVNNLVHPAVFRSFESWKKNQTNPIVFNESALLFETGSYQRFDFTILVIADENTKVNRIRKRDEISENEIKNRMKNQLSDIEKIKLSNFIVENNENVLVIPQLLRIVSILKQN
jgi:dephospho-CoA kinase